MFKVSDDEMISPTTETYIKEALDELQRSEKPEDLEQVKMAFDNISDGIVKLNLSGYSINQIAKAINKKLPFISERVVYDEIKRILCWHNNKMSHDIEEDDEAYDGLYDRLVEI